MQDNNNTQELSQIEKRRLANRLSYQRNREKRLAACRSYGEKNRDKRLANGKKYWQQNKEKLKASCNAYYYANKDKISAHMREWRLKNLDVIKQKISTPEFKKRSNELRRKWYRTNINAKLRAIADSRLRRVLKGKKASIDAEVLFGCTIEQLRIYLESLFLEGMTWENYNHKTWHVDHIRPCNTFDLSDPEQQKICFHYTNLRPLWAKDNWSRPKDGSDL
jgi:hypothetical protein